MAARHVMEGEERVARQQAVVERMLKAGYRREATEAAKLLKTMQTTLRARPRASAPGKRATGTNSTRHDPEAIMETDDILLFAASGFWPRWSTAPSAWPSASSARQV